MLAKTVTRIRTRWLAAAVLLAVSPVPQAPSHAAAPKAKSTFTADFREPAELSAWQMPFPEDWETRKEDGVAYLHMKRSREPGVPRRPLQFALLKDIDASSFTLDVKVRRAQGSMIVVFDYVDSLHFYYVHLSRDPGSEQPVHNGIFIVDGGPRRRIAGIEAAPALPDLSWHEVRLVRDVPSGSIQVFLDREKAARFSIVDRTFTQGRVGLGSFDETGDFSQFRLRMRQ